MTPLLSPVRFFAIRHGRSLRYNFVIPGVAATCLSSLLMLWPNVGGLTGDGGLLPRLQDPLAIAGGFFVAALTLVTADRSELMKSPVIGPNPPTLAGEVLSRRRFLSFLFGYLSFTAFALVAVALLADLMAPGLRGMLGARGTVAAKVAFLIPFTFWLAHMATSTLLGLYYFTERLQVSDRRVVVGKPNRSSL